MNGRNQLDCGTNQEADRNGWEEMEALDEMG